MDRNQHTQLLPHFTTVKAEQLDFLPHKCVPSSIFIDIFKESIRVNVQSHPNSRQLSLCNCCLCCAWYWDSLGCNRLLSTAEREELSNKPVHWWVLPKRDTTALYIRTKISDPFLPKSLFHLVPSPWSLNLFQCIYLLYVYNSAIFFSPPRGEEKVRGKHQFARGANNSTNLLVSVSSLQRLF